MKRGLRSQYLVQHNKDEWFQLNPDLLIQQDGVNKVVLDTKWKLLDSAKANGTDKYDLGSFDFYQMLAYATNYLTTNSERSDTIILIYPKTKTFDEPLPVFEFNNLKNIKLWVLSFCIADEKGLLLPQNDEFSESGLLNESEVLKESSAKIVVHSYIH